MEKLVEQVQPSTHASAPEGTSASRSSPSMSTGDSGAYWSGSGSESPYTPPSISMSMSGGTGVGMVSAATAGSSSKLRSARQALFDIYPNQHDVELILAGVTGNKMVEHLLYTEHDVARGRAMSPHDAMSRPSPDAHPVVIAKRLLHFAICLQHMSPQNDPSLLDARIPAQDLASRFVSTVGTVVCLDDELVCCAEGLEVLTLHVSCHVSVGNLRKAWVAARRALSLGDLMGANTQSRLGVLPYCDPGNDPLRRPNPAVVWFNLSDFERYLSLVLGLPSASRDEAFKMVEQATVLSPMEKMAVAHGLATGRIIERNLVGMDDYMTTLDIDCDLKRAADAMPPTWWATLTDVAAANSSLQADDEFMRRVSKLILQTRHYSLIILLHLPYVLRPAADSRWAHSKTTCLAASREVLSRYAQFRSLYDQRTSCRHMDYFCLVASMTLVLGYLDARQNGPGDAERRLADRMLVEDARVSMAEQARVTGDKLTGDAAEVVRQLMPIINRGVTTCSEARDAIRQGVKLKIPYLGTVNINDGERPPCGGMDKAAKESGWENGGGDAAGGRGLAGAGGASHEQPRNEAGFDDTVLRLSVDPGFMDPAALQGQLGGGPQDMEANLSGVPGGLDVDSAFLLDDAQMMQPGLTADADDWSFQGIDTTYWSLLNGGFM